MNDIDLSALNDLLQKLFEAASAYPNEIAIGAGGMVVLTIFWMARRNAIRNRLKQYAPKLQMTSFQISPLGRDGFFKIQNSGEPAVLKNIHFSKRKDLTVRDQYRDSKIGKFRDYALLIEATGQERISNQFLITLEYADEKGYTYRQVFDPTGRSSKSPKYIGRKHSRPIS
jgi:hypothetical protein